MEFTEQEQDMLNRLRENDAEVDGTLGRLSGHEDIYIKYLKEFPQNKNYVNMCNAADAGNMSEVEGQAHQLKGDALNMGFLDLADECTDMRMDILDGDTQSALKKLEKIKKLFKKWSDAITG